MAFDNFNRANQVGLGESAEGWSWVKVGGDDSLDIVSNQAAHAGGSLRNLWRAEIDLSSPDHFAQVDVASLGAVNHHLLARFSAIAETGYQLVFTNSVTNTWRLQRLVSGSGTTLATVEEAPPTQPFTMRLEVEDDASGNAVLTARVDGQIKIGPITDVTPISGFLRTGIGTSGSNTNLAYDNFTADALETIMGIQVTANVNDEKPDMTVSPVADPGTDVVVTVTDALAGQLRSGDRDVLIRKIANLLREIQ